MDGTVAPLPNVRLVLIVGTILTVLAFISVCARLYTRYGISHQPWFDDLTAVAALLATIATNVTQSTNAVRYLAQLFSSSGWEDNISNYLFTVWLNDIFYNTAMLFIKMTFLLQYFHVFRHVYTMWVAYIVAMVVVGLWSLAQIFMVIFGCLPVQGSWDPAFQAHCWIQLSFVYINGAGTIVTDLIVLFLPLPTLLRLKLRRSQKLGLIGIFAIGGIVPIISIARLASLTGEFPDNIVQSNLYSIAELCAGIITASLATIRLLVNRVVPTLASIQGAHELTSKSRQNSTASQRDLFEEDDVEVPRRTLSSDAGARKETGRQLRESISTMSLGNRPARKFVGTTDSLHFGLPGHLRTGVKTKITTGPSRGRSMSAGGADFLNTFGIRVERDWAVSESPAQE